MVPDHLHQNRQFQAARGELLSNTAWKLVLTLVLVFLEVSTKICPAQRIVSLDRSGELDPVNLISELMIATSQISPHNIDHPPQLPDRRWISVSIG